MRLASIVLLLAPAALYAHDLWILPPNQTDVGKPLIIRAHSGDEFPTSTSAPDPAKFSKRFARLPDGTIAPIESAGTKDQSGLMRFEAQQAGVFAIGVQTIPKIIQLEAAKFNAYLVGDGLSHIFLLRHKEKSLDQPAVERYSKSPKLLLKIGEGKGDPCQPLGLPLEIVPLADPFERTAGQALPVRVLFQGKPLADANLGWDWPGPGERPRGTARTNEKGEALVPLANSGLFTIRLTHMTRPKAADHEWESFWTTLTFLVAK